MRLITRSVILQPRKFIVPALIVAGILLGTFLVQGNGRVPTSGKTVRYYGKACGKITDLNGHAKIYETGTATHVGNFTLAGESERGSDQGYILFILTSASKDELHGFVSGTSDYGTHFYFRGGTGRFEYARGFALEEVSDWQKVTDDPLTYSYTATIRGMITTVGENKKPAL